MRVQLDTEKKTIKVENDVNLHDFFAFIKNILPNNKWKEFTLESHTVINNWTNPIVIKEIERVPWPSPIWVHNDSNKQYTLNDGVYCLQAETSTRLNG